MDYLLDSDFYEVQVVSLITNIDRDVLIDLYQPLVGANAVMLYLTLYKKSKEDDSTDFYTMSDLFATMNLSAGQIVDARKALEAVGLIQTYFKNEQELRYFIFEIFAPKSPKDFFDDVLFNGLLISYVGEKNAEKLAFKYQLHRRLNKSFANISASFRDVFNPNYSDKSFRTNLGIETLGHESGRVRTDFHLDTFFRAIDENTQINHKILLPSDLLEIERLSSLFDIDEVIMARIVQDVYDPFNNLHLNCDKLLDACKSAATYPLPKKKANLSSGITSGTTLLAEKIKMMDNRSPIRFLQYLQNNTQPADSDIQIVDYISKKYGFSNGVMNAIIDYSLVKCNNILKRNYIDKIASSVARDSSIKTTLDAMNFLKRDSKKQRENVLASNKTDEMPSYDEPKIEKKDNESSIEDDKLTPDEERQLAKILNRRRE